MVGVKEFSGLQVFEFIYLMALAFLPFVILIQQVFYTILTMISIAACIALYKKFRYHPVNPHGKLVVITGCDTGFGNAIARRLLKQGFQVVAACLDENSEGAIQLRENTSGLLTVCQMDVTKDDEIDACLQLTKELAGERGVWALINNAGIFMYGDLELCPLDEFRRVMEVNVFGVLKVTRKFLPLIRCAKGRVITMSGAGGLMAFPSQSAFCMTQHSLVAMMDSLRLEMNAFGVKVINLLPGSYFGTTRHLNKRELPKWQSQLEERKTCLDQELLSAYGEAYLDSQHLVLSELSSSSAGNMAKVLDTLEKATRDHKPQGNYLVDGGKELFDLPNMMIRLRVLLPPFLSDYILTKVYSCQSNMNGAKQKEKEN